MVVRRVHSVTDRPSEEILAKVRKLLALGESPSEAEAASALAKARSLLARHGLSLEDVKPERDDIVESAILEKRRLRAWESHLVAVVTDATFTRALHVTAAGTSRVLIVGREVNTGAAKALFEYLHLVVLKLGRANGEQVAHLESFKLGVVHRIGERLAAGEEGVSGANGPWTANDGTEGARTNAGKQAKAHDRANRAGADTNPECAQDERRLTVQMTRATSRENDAYISEKYGKTKTKRTGRRVEPDSFYRGRAAGDTVSLARQLANR